MRFRAGNLLTASLLGAALLQPTTAATAAAASCRGVPATITASGVPSVDGTEGNDVIVADNVGSVRALGGDDVICVTGRTFGLVDAGAGNDVVDASGKTESRTTTDLGEGNDTFLGSASYDEVYPGTADRVDPGRDVIDAGPAGPEQDLVVSGQPGVANPDEITGDWAYVDWAGTPTATSEARGGAGSTFAINAKGLTTLEIDVPTRSLTTSGSGTALTLRGFTTFSVGVPRDLERLTFRGSNRDESLFLPGVKRTVVRAAMGGGDDTLGVGTYANGSSLSGGDGRDHINVRAASRVDLDLGRERFAWGRGSTAVAYDANGFEDAFVSATTARLIGTRAPNKLSTDACSTWIEGLGGRDRLTAFNDSGFEHAGKKCRNPGTITAHLFGGSGNDTLHGSKAWDLLIGGPGRDRADGNQGRDTCQAEVRTSCEVRR